MANELNIALAKSGLTVTAQRYQAGAAVGSAISLTEVASSGFYSGNMTGSAGTYQLAFLASSANVGSGSIVWDGTAEVTSSAPTVAQIRTEMDSNSTKLANLDTTVSSRLAPNGTLATVTNLTNAPASVTPSDIWSHASRTITGGTVDTLTNAPSVPSAATIASQVRTELATELARVDQAISTRATPANIPAADITAIKAKTDAINVDRINNTATLSQVGNLLAQANS